MPTIYTNLAQYDSDVIGTGGVQGDQNIGRRNVQVVSPPGTAQSAVILELRNIGWAVRVVVNVEGDVKGEVSWDGVSYRPAGYFRQVSASASTLVPAASLDDNIFFLNGAAQDPCYAFMRFTENQVGGGSVVSAHVSA